MKKNGIAIPIVLAGIVLFLVLIKAITYSDFKRTPSETLQLARENKHFIGPLAITAIPADQLVIIKIGLGKLPSFSSSIQTKETDFNLLLSKELKSLFADNKKMKILFAVDLSDAVKAWTFLTRMGYTNLYVYDPDNKKLKGQDDSITSGNEELQYTFKPEKSESE